MITTKVNSILPEFDLDLRRVAVSVSGTSDPPSLPKVGITRCRLNPNLSIGG